MFARGFVAEQLTTDEVSELKERARRARGAILTMTSAANSGHPGGSMSSIECYLLVYHLARLRPHDPCWEGRDRVLIEHGHTSPGAYAALADAGFFPMEEAVAHFRQTDSPFEGHVERTVPGIEWNTGNLGQGLSAAVGMALSARLTGLGWHTYCLMGDGGQHKGQAAEARRVAVHHGLADLTVLIDRNHVQISGHTDEVMRVDIAADWEADGWGVLEVDGHDFTELYSAIRRAHADTDRPVAVICQTTIGKGVSFMEDDPAWHGAALGGEEYERAMEELGLAPELDRALAKREEAVRIPEIRLDPPSLEVDPGAARTYGPGELSDCRSAWGAALVDLEAANPELPMAVIDCDLLPSVKTGGFAKARPKAFIQTGIAEHNAAAMSGAMSICGVLTFWSDFGVFGVDEVYNQQRLNDINCAALKLALTHCGLDVGEDGKTHQCLDYVGAFRNFFGWKVVIPADPNQTDRIVRWAASEPGNIAIAMGRSKIPVVLGEDGLPFFAGEYAFEYGRIDWVRHGDHATLLTMGTVAPGVVAASDALSATGVMVDVGIVSSPLEVDDDDMVRAAATGIIVTVEDHHARTGLAASVAEWLAENGKAVRFIRLGVDRYASSGPSSELLRAQGLDSEGVEIAVRMALAD